MPAIPREVAVVTDVHPDASHRGVEDRITHVAGTKVELLPETLDVRDVGLAVLAEIGAVGINDRCGVVVEASCSTSNIGMTSTMPVSLASFCIRLVVGPSGIGSA